MKKCFAEFLGTFALVFFGTGAVVINNISGGAVGPQGVGLTFGLIVMAMIYTFGDLSGAHLNPAVTVGFGLAGKFPWREVPKYLASQFTGALLASAVVLALFENKASLGATLPAHGNLQSFILEIILTAILMLVILKVATGSKEVGQMAGIAIGGIIALEALVAGPISGASMNPARSLAPALLSGNTATLWIYLTAPFLGAALGVACWRATQPNKI